MKQINYTSAYGNGCLFPKWVPAELTIFRNCSSRATKI